MTIIQSMQKELEKEAVITRKMLERVPEDRYDWKPHEKSMTVRQLAGHVAELPGWIGLVLNTTELDFAKNPYTPPNFDAKNELLTFFEQTVAESKAEMAKATESKLVETWTLRNGEEIYSREPKEEVLRMTISQVIHHRAQLGVYLRLLDIPVPASYGPSADES